MRIQEGQPARPFQVKDIQDRLITLEDFRGQKLLLSFFRYASCPLCNLRVRHLILRHQEFSDKGLRVVGFFESPKESILRYVGRQNPPFPIVPDPRCEVYDLYGVQASWLAYLKAGLRPKTMFDAMFKEGFKPGKMEGRIAMVPADFLIGPDLTVRKAYYGKDISDHMPMAEIDRFLSHEG